MEEKSFILNKAAQIFVYTCLCDYPCRWPTLFHELNETLRIGIPAVDIYLRILLAIDGEVADRDIVHGAQVGLILLCVMVLLLYKKVGRFNVLCMNDM